LRRIPLGKNCRFSSQTAAIKSPFNPVADEIRRL
jgi:hypothetical protein